jgi:hypothetical protein
MTNVNADPDQRAEPKTPISVVIPLYNKELTVLRAVKSVLSQLGPQDELIVVNDGSTDHSVAQIISVSDQRFQLIDSANCGVAAARNLGSKATKNDYIAFLDADDWWQEGALECFRGMISQHKNAELYSFGHRRSSDPQPMPHDTKSHHRSYQIWDFEAFMKTYARRDVVNSSTVCVRKESLFEIGGFPHGVLSGEDIYVWLRLGLLGSVVHSEATLATIDRRPPTKSHARHGVPYHLVWISEPETGANLAPEQQQALKMFVSGRALPVCGGAALEGRRSDALKIAKLVFRIAPWTGILTLFTSVAPSPLLMAYNTHRRRAHLKKPAEFRKMGWPICPCRNV